MLRLSLAALLLSNAPAAFAGFAPQAVSRAKSSTRSATRAVVRHPAVAQVRRPAAASRQVKGAETERSNGRGSHTRAAETGGPYSRSSWSSFSSGRGLDSASVARRSSRAFALSRRAESDVPDEPAPSDGPSMPIVEHQFIRSEGLGFTYAPPAEGQRLLAVEAGTRIEANGYAQALTNHHQLFTGKKDALPPPNPNNNPSGASGANAITEN